LNNEATSFAMGCFTCFYGKNIFLIIIWPALLCSFSLVHLRGTLFKILKINAKNFKKTNTYGLASTTLMIPSSGQVLAKGKVLLAGRNATHAALAITQKVKL